MATVDFYVLAQADERARHMLACKLAEKAWRLENTVYIHAKAAADAERSTSCSGLFATAAFVPHGLAGRNDGTEVIADHDRLRRPRTSSRVTC